MNHGLLLLLPIFVPVSAGVLCIALPALENRRALYLLVSAALSLELVVVIAILAGPVRELTLPELSRGLPLLLRADLAAKCFCLLAAAMFLAAGVFSFDYMEREGNQRRFYLFYLSVLGMLCGLGLSGNLLTLYLFFEGMTLLSMPLVMHSMTRQSITAAFRYLFYSIAGASLALIGLYYSIICGGAGFSPGGALDPARLAERETGMLIASLLAIVGFGAKAGMFPMHAWLPEAHPAAPAPASAVLSGVITKSGVFAVLRFVFYTVGPGFLRGTFVQTVWMSLALVSVLMGAALALEETVLKRRLAYSSISQLGYVLFGLATLSPAGAAGAALLAVFHSVAKTGLFLCAGAILCRTGRTEVRELRGLGRELPVTLWCFTLFTLSAVGVPPMGGFVGKWRLLLGSLTAEIGVFSRLGPAVLLLGALFTAGYLLPIVARAFFPGGDCGAPTARDPGLPMLIPLALLAAGVLLPGLFSGGLTGLLERMLAPLF